MESEGEQAVKIILSELVEEKKIKLAGSNFGDGEDVHLNELYEAFVGLENLSCSSRQAGYIEAPLVEDARVSHFTNITGELISSMVIEAYEHNSKIADSLVSEYPTRYRDERVPGFSASDPPKEVKEGDAYEDSGLYEKWITLGTAIKKGRIISITEEAVYYDQTAQLVERAEGIGEMCGLDREKAILRVILGVVTGYYPSGTAKALYGAAPYKVTSNALVDWTSIEKCLLSGFEKMEDENGEAIVVNPTTLLLPTNLLMTGRQIINATEIEGRNTDGTAGTTAQARIRRSANVVDNYQIVSSPQISRLQTANGTTNWWLGNFKKQFKWKKVWPLQTFRENQGAQVQFERDIVSRYKVRYKGNAFVVDEKYVVLNKA